MAGHGGGAWKVAYADFVTAMMAFLMVMWLTEQKPEVKQAVAGYFRDPYAIYKGAETGAATTPVPTTDPKLGHDSESQKRRLPNAGDDSNYQFTVLFNESDAALDAVGREQIRQFAPTLVGKLNIIEVKAHCLRKPLPAGSEFPDRWHLCFARSLAVMEQLESLGVEAERIQLGQAEANQPIAGNLSDEELKLNSRVDVILLPDLVETAWQKAEPRPENGTEPAHGSKH
jgi:chemotaxis protein MotB